MHWERTMRHLAAAQEGTVGIHQMATIGGDHQWFTRARRSGRWWSLSENVLRADGWPETVEQRAFAGVLDAGPTAFLYPESSLAWFGMRNRCIEPVQAGRRRGTSNRDGALAHAHRLRDVRPSEILVVRGLPVLSPLRSIWVEAARVSGWPSEIGVLRIGRLVDDANRTGLVRLDELHRSVTELGRRGRAGTAIMRHVADARPPGSSVTESRNEDRLVELLAGAGVAPLRAQVVVGGDRPIGRTDFRDGDLPMVAEVNSITFHSTVSDRDADRHRYGALLDAGFAVAVVWEDDLWSNTASVLSTVDDARRAARRGRPDVFHSASCPWPQDRRDPIRSPAPRP